MTEPGIDKKLVQEKALHRLAFGKPSPQKPIFKSDVTSSGSPDSMKASNQGGKENTAKGTGKPGKEAQKVSDMPPVSGLLSQDLAPCKATADDNASEDATQKSKAQLRAERRVVQEAQRKAKEARGDKKGDTEAKLPTAAAPQVSKKAPAEPFSAGTAAEKKGLPARKPEKTLAVQREPLQKKVNLFSHLRQGRHGVSLTEGMLFSSTVIHPAILKLGLQYASGTICGSNARCVGMLAAFKKVISDYTTPLQKELSRDLGNAIKPYIAFLNECRPLSVSMGSAIKYLKRQINHIPSDISDAEAKQILLEAVDNFYRERIKESDNVIAKNYAQQKISNQDVILVYAWSSLVLEVLAVAHDLKKTFRVIVVDARPKLEGREMLRRLTRLGVHCTYVLINSVSYIMKEVTKVFLGAHSLLANGYVMSRVGTSQVALVAQAYGVPVLVCCETYKFSEKVQTDSFVWNELGDADDLLKIDTRRLSSSDHHNLDNLTFLNLVYDVTPPKYITMVITEVGMIPCTSAPVVLRVKQHLEE